VQQEVRRETYGEDIGQTGWMTTQEFCRFLQLLALDAESKVLEVGSGAGGCALFMAQQTGCRVTGIDINEHWHSERQHPGADATLGAPCEVRTH
jgi:cyclopropane fatty-acyl-phospholipid synthase-like methyltransferase